MKKASLLFLSFTFGVISIFADETVKNIIFMIGDGMGLNQMYAAMTHNNNRLNFERCSYLGLSKTYSANSYITDSAAGGTALACGVKTNNGMIGETPDSIAVKSMLHFAEEKGLATGIVVTCSVTHATPAAFIAHQPSRSMDKEIAADFLNTDIDVFIGGGKKYFENGIDNRNLIDELRKKDYQICFSLDELGKINSGKVAGLFAEEHLGKVTERGDMLATSVQKTLDILSQTPKGFFLMIEGSQIDWGGHQNDANYLLDEMADFDRTIGLVLDFAEKNGNTLVVITADHETGGMIISNGNFKSGEVNLTFTTKHHTGVLVPVYSFGKGAEKFTGIYENTSFLDKFLKLWKIND